MDEDKLKSLSKYIKDMEIASTKMDAQVILDSINIYADDLWNKDRDIAEQLTKELDVSAFRKAMGDSTNELFNVRQSLYATGVSEVTSIPKSGHSRVYYGGVYYDDSLVAEDSKLTLDELRVQAEALGYALVKIEYESTDLTGTNKIKLN